MVCVTGPLQMVNDGLEADVADVPESQEKLSVTV